MQAEQQRMHHQNIIELPMPQPKRTSIPPKRSTIARLRLRCTLHSDHNCVCVITPSDEWWGYRTGESR
eukprot:m.362383 g.362383  ORF g.362383 m.362383 type:complete len:68 (-) comp20424_c0_seq1:1365-1568(-)